MTEEYDDFIVISKKWMDSFRKASPAVQAGVIDILAQNATDTQRKINKEMRQKATRVLNDENSKNVT